MKRSISGCGGPLEISDRAAAKERHCEKTADYYFKNMTKLVEIQSAILQLEPAERAELRHWLDETAEETPEMLAAIDEGLRSLKEKGIIPLDESERKFRYGLQSRLNGRSISRPRRSSPLLGREKPRGRNESGQ